MNSFMSPQGEVPSGFNLEDLPYPLHTNNELLFMLERNKPLAHFSDAYSDEPNEDIFPEQSFAPHVASGRFVMRDFVIPDAALSKRLPHIRGIRHLFYALSHEAWRIDAFIMMMAAAAKAGWSQGFERLEGSLLGYEEWQIDIHIERLKKRLTSDSGETAPKAGPPV